MSLANLSEYESLLLLFLFGATFCAGLILGGRNRAGELHRQDNARVG